MWPVHLSTKHSGKWEIKSILFQNATCCYCRHDWKISWVIFICKRYSNQHTSTPAPKLISCWGSCSCYCLFNANITPCACGCYTCFIRAWQMRRRRRSCKNEASQRCVVRGAGRGSHSVARGEAVNPVGHKEISAEEEEEGHRGRRGFWVWTQRQKRRSHSSREREWRRGSDESDFSFVVQMLLATVTA